ncbi:MAG: LysM peptidoglycan-binding domain-containing protein [Anaerolineae bacterium]|nr:LysM peptidoglycan-binding domain-containing protein [Anaerolineae bacterium]
MNTISKSRRSAGYRIVIASIMLSLLVSASTDTVLPQRVDFYIVQIGDTWAGIAARYSVPVKTLWSANGVVNPNRLAAGQRLLIPSTSTQQAILTFESSTISPWQAALRSGNTLSVVLSINGLESPSEASGIGLYVPDKRESIGQVVLAQPTPTQPPSPTPRPSIERTPIPGPPLVRSRLGIQGYFAIPELMDHWLNKTTDAGFTWVKYQVDWRLTENPAGSFPILSVLDSFMENAQNRHLNVLLSVVKAPDWARSTTEGYGPPDHYKTFTIFVKYLASRYKTRLDSMQIAFEIWNEPNTLREWTGQPLSAQDYVSLLAGAYIGIKEEDQRYTVISAGLAPTGINDGVTSIDDRVYLRQMYDAELSRVTDAIGVHPYGWANPPSTRCCGDPNTSPGYDEHPSFFFLNTIEDYRAIQAEYGDTKKLWVTEFGWGSAEGTGIAAPSDAPYHANTTQNLQAEYIWQAYLMAQQWDYMGPMFLWNLNMHTIPSVPPEAANYSLFLDLDNPRPAYILLHDAPKTD